MAKTFILLIENFKEQQENIQSSFEKRIVDSNNKTFVINIRKNSRSSSYAWEKY